MNKENLIKKTYEELRKIATKKKIEGRSKMNKNELIKAIQKTMKKKNGGGLLNSIKSIPGRVIGTLPRLPYRNLPHESFGSYNEFTGEFIGNQDEYVFPLTEPGKTIITHLPERARNDEYKNGNVINENINFNVIKRKKEKQYEFYKIIGSKIPESEFIKVMVYPKNKENPVEYLLKNHTYFEQPDSKKKPIGAWLSNKFKEQGNRTWVNFVIGNDFNNRVNPLKNDIYLVELIDDNKKILRLKTSLEMLDFTLQYGVLTEKTKRKLERIKNNNYYDMINVEINWKKVQDDGYYGIDISPYIYEMRMVLMWYYGWDCSSQCIWDYRGIKSITKLNIEDELRGFGFV